MESIWKTQPVDYVKLIGDLLLSNEHVIKRYIQYRDIQDKDAEKNIADMLLTTEIINLLTTSETKKANKQVVEIKLSLILSTIFTDNKIEENDQESDIDFLKKLIISYGESK